MDQTQEIDVAEFHQIQITRIITCINLESQLWLTDHSNRQIMLRLLINQQSDQLLNMQVCNKRCEQIPSQFISKHSHKYIMRKTLINTKFQWLSKYLSDDAPPEETRISRAIQITNKPTTLPPSKLLKESQPKINKLTPSLSTAEQHKSTNTFTHDRSFHILPRQPNQALRIKTENDENIFVRKKGVRNKSLLFHNIKRKECFLLQKQNRSNTTQIKPHAQREVSRSKNIRQKRYEEESFALCPWAFPENNNEIGDYLPFL